MRKIIPLKQKIWMHRLLLVGWISLMGCSSTKLVNSWEDKAFKGPPMKHILVLGVFNPEDNRRVFEEGLAAAFESQGVSSVAGHTLIPGVRGYDEKEKIRSAVENTGVDGVLLAILKGVDKQDRFIPPKTELKPVMNDRYGLYDFYGHSVQEVYVPGYTVTDTIVRLEISLFQVSGEQMVWKGSTRSINLPSKEKITKETGEVVIKALKRAGLI